MLFFWPSGIRQLQRPGHGLSVNVSVQLLRVNSGQRGPVRPLPPPGGVAGARAPPPAGRDPRALQLVCAQLNAPSKRLFSDPSEARPPRPPDHMPLPAPLGPEAPPRVLRSARRPAFVPLLLSPLHSTCQAGAASCPGTQGSRSVEVLPPANVYKPPAGLLNPPGLAALLWRRHACASEDARPPSQAESSSLRILWARRRPPLPSAGRSARRAPCASSGVHGEARLSGIKAGSPVGPHTAGCSVFLGRKRTLRLCFVLRWRVRRKE